MASKHSSKKSKSKKKHSREKHKRKKEKKSKKEVKERKRKHSSSSSSTNSDNSEDIVEQPKWNFLEDVMSESNVTVRDKKIVKTKNNTDLYDPKFSTRELNPYWKDNGTGLPPDLPVAKSKTKFLKPEEGTVAEIKTKTFSNNWRKKDFKLSDIRGTIEENNINKNIKQDDKKNSEILTNNELNSLGAKLVKAEILGNKALVEKLKMQLDAAKKAKETADSNSKEVVIVTSNNAQCFRKPFEKNKPSASKKQKLDAYNQYELENDKYSLKNLFVKEKTECEEDFLKPSNIKVNNVDEFDDLYIEAASSEKSIKKRERQKDTKEKQEAIKKHKTLEGCLWCLDNRNDTKHLIVSTGSKCYLCLPKVKSLSEGHCFIVPIQHEFSTRKLDEDVWDELKTYQRVLTKMFLEQGMDTIFFENARSFRHYPHCFIQCVPLDKEMGSLAPIYFQKAISESETEWSNNKKVINFRHKDLRKSIPRDLPYFAVSFGTEGGFAHLIEDEQLFPRNFAEEVIGGMLDLDPGRWRKPSLENFNEQREKALAFLKIWKKYEFNSNSSDSDSSSTE